jgi:hypothetical protein
MDPGTVRTEGAGTEACVGQWVCLKVQLKPGLLLVRIQPSWGKDEMSDSSHDSLPFSFFHSYLLSFLSFLCCCFLRDILSSYSSYSSVLLL